MIKTVAGALRRQLEDRRERLSAGIATDGPDADLVRLLRQVDSALGRFGTPDYARCLVCNGHVLDEDLRLNPLMEYCLCSLSPEQERALQRDLELARRIQAALLPDPHVTAAGWEASYRYEPAGVVSGDFCDLWVRPDEAGALYFAVGDVASLQLEPGDTLLLYTDGLSEARLPGGEEYGAERIERELAQRAACSAPRQLVHGMREALSGFLGEAQHMDDLTMLALRRAAA